MNSLPTGTLITVDKNTSTRSKSLPNPNSSCLKLFVDLKISLSLLHLEVFVDLDVCLVLDLQVEQLDPHLLQLGSIRVDLDCKARVRTSRRLHPIRHVLATGRVEQVGDPLLHQVLRVLGGHLIADQQVGHHLVHPALLLPLVRQDLGSFDRLPLVGGEGGRVKLARELGDRVDDVLGGEELGVVHQQLLRRLRLLKESD